MLQRIAHGPRLVDLAIKLVHVRLRDALDLAAGAVPTKESFDAWLVMGGPMNVDETNRYPYLPVEKDLLANLIAWDRPVLGICLGAQLIARACGAKVYPKRPKEIGLYTVDITAEGKQDFLFCNMDNSLQVFQWHGDTFDLPPGAVRLARSERFENQAFRLGKRVYALQFHIEADLRIARQWKDQWTHEISALPEEDKNRITGCDLEKALTLQNRIARRLILKWAGMISS